MPSMEFGLDAVVLEMQIDSKSPDEKVRIRKSMTDPKTYPSVGSVVVGFTMFTPSIHAMLMSRAVPAVAAYPAADEDSSVLPILDSSDPMFLDSYKIPPI